MNAPFSIGQKVVCINDVQRFSYRFDFNKVIYPEKGQLLTVRCIENNPLDRFWYVIFEEIKNPKFRYSEGCDETFFDCKYFAPIQTNYADATAEILEKFKQTDDMPDKIIIHEPINQ